MTEPSRYTHSSSRSYSPDPFLDNISQIPPPNDSKMMRTPILEPVSEFARIPHFTPNIKPLGKRIFSMYVLSVSIGFGIAWFGATAFDHLNVKIDSLRDRLDISPYQ